MDYKGGHLDQTVREKVQTVCKITKIFPQRSFFSFLFFLFLCLVRFYSSDLIVAFQIAWKRFCATCFPNFWQIWCLSVLQLEKWAFPSCAVLCLCLTPKTLIRVSGGRNAKAHRSLLVVVVVVGVVGGWSVRRLHNHAAAANMCGSNSDL